MEYSCTKSSCDYDGEGPALFVSKKVTARTTHRCTECGHKINPGQAYEKIDGVWDGSWGHFKTCEGCLSLIDTFFNNRPCFGDLWDDFHNDYNYRNTVIPEKCISQLLKPARDIVCEIVEKNWIGE